MVNSILVVEDNAPLLEVLSDYLECIGYRVWQAHNADEAFAQLSDNMVDLVLTDAQMPGLHGLEFFSILHRNYNVPIMVVTGMYRDEARNWPGQAGIREVLFKPVDLKLLHDKIQHTFQTLN